MVYLDTSLVVALFAPEAASTAVRRWLGRQAAGSLAISGWVSAELASALSIKVRAGTLAVDQRAAIDGVWRSLRQALVELAIDESTFRTAEAWAARHETGVRAGDALHLAAAAAHGCTLATLDERLRKAAPKLGVVVAKV